MSAASRILTSFPYAVPREIQTRSLEVLEANWDKYDVFVLQAPTAYGKSAVAKSLMKAFTSASFITPSNLLVHQFLTEFPDTRCLHRLDSYRCEEWKRPCSITRGKLGGFCKGCPAAKDLMQAKYRTGPGVYNYHTYLAHKLYRDILIIDEAHQLLPVIRDRLALTIWQHDYPYPDNMYSLPNMKSYIESLPPTKRRNKKIQQWYHSVVSRKPEYMPQRTELEFNGKGTLRGQPEMRDCIRLLPMDISDAPPMFWPRESVKKVVLLSATISRKDIEALGLNRRGKVLYISCESPIPASARPIVVQPVASVNRYNLEESAGKIAEYIEDVLVPQHAGEKGVVHATYQMSGLLKKHLSGSKYMFHTRENKKEVYEAFRRAPADSGAILVACGMYEGIDLPEDLGRWQVISKIPWPSLGSPAIAYQAEKDPEWMTWETLKIVIQACGRICRTEKDFGVTFVLDGNFTRLYNNAQAAGLVPAWYEDGLIEGRKLV